MEMLVSLSVSERYFWVVFYPRPFLSHLKGQTIVVAQVFLQRSLQFTCFR